VDNLTFIVFRPELVKLMSCNVLAEKVLYFIGVLQILVSFTSLLKFNLGVLLWQFVKRKGCA
jgi:hypothetical protein